MIETIVNYSFLFTITFLPQTFTESDIGYPRLESHSERKWSRTGTWSEGKGVDGVRGILRDIERP